MSRWQDVVDAAPEFADRVQSLFQARKHKTLATLRSDGSPRISGTETQFDHCQNLQPNPFQFWAGTSGWPALVQCAIQSSVPAAATAVEWPRCERQKRGEV